MMTSKTAGGIVVDVEPVGREYCGSPVAEVVLRFLHPTAGRCRAVVTRYGSVDGTAGAVGHGFAGERADGSGGTYLPTACVTIPRADFDAALAAARTLAGAAVARVKAEAEAGAAAAVAACPTGFVACRQVWSNGDLASAEYVTADGVKVLGSDLLQNHGGWYWIKDGDVAAARAAADADAARRTAARSARPVDRWMEDCDGSVPECSADLCVRTVSADGTVKVTRTHTH